MPRGPKKRVKMADMAAMAAMADTLVAYDASGSTGGNRFYHDETQRIVNGLQGEPTILFWDDTHRVISRSELKRINKKQMGFRGTEPAEIAKHVTKTGFHGHLVIITDGQVSNYSVDACDEIMERQWAFESVTAYLIGPSRYVNMSVTCPFTRQSPHAVYVLDRDAEEPIAPTIVSREDMDLLDSLEAIGTSEDFLLKAEAIERAVVARTMGTMGDPTIRDTILAMKKRIVANDALAKGQSGTVTGLWQALEAGETERAVKLARAVADEYYGENDDFSWSGRISRLVSMCEGALRGAFDLSGVNNAIQGDRVRRAGEAAAAAATSAPSTEATQGDDGGSSFTCPISLDKANDVVILVSSEGEPVLAGVDKSVVNDLIDCPLNLFKYPEVMDRLKGKLDHPLSLEVLKEAEASGRPLEVSPFTRRAVEGAICLGADEQHCKATTWTLARALTAGKLVGSPDLWYACVWLMAEYGLVEWLKEVLPQLRANMLWRTRNHKTAISLSGLPEFPTTRVPLGVAAWFVFGSAAIGLPPARDVLRAHLPHIEHLQKLVSITGYSLPEAVEAHLLRLRCMLGMLSAVKKDRHRLPNAMAALTQRCIVVEPEKVSPKVVQREGRVVRYIPVDGPPTSQQISAVYETLPAYARSFDIPTLTGLAALVDPNKSASDVHLPITWTPPSPRDPVVEWGYGLGPIAEMKHRICSATCRPFYVIGRETWKEESERTFGPLSGQLPACKRFGDFVVKYKAYPTREDFMTYLYNRFIVFGRHKTLPAAVESIWEGTQRIHASVAGSIEPDEFARRFTEATEVKKRKRLEVWDD